MKVLSLTNLQTFSKLEFPVLDQFVSPTSVMFFTHFVDQQLLLLLFEELKSFGELMLFGISGYVSLFSFVLPCFL